VPWSGGFGGVAKTVDDGASWTRIDGGLPLQPGANTQLAVHPSAGGTLYVNLNLGSPNNGFKSTDGGSTWTRLPTYAPSSSQSIARSSPQVMYVVNGPYGMVLKTVTGAQ
jgi:hypothetical protein